MRRLLPAVSLLAFLVPACAGEALEPVPPPPPSASAPIASASEAPPPPPAKPAPVADATLTSRALLFGNPERMQPKLSPDGKRLAFVAPKDGVLNVFVGPADKPGDAKPVTKDTSRGIRMYGWAYTNQHIFYMQDQKGDENFHVYVVDLKTGTTKDLTPFDGVRGEIWSASEKTPKKIVLGMNDRDKKWHDPYLVDIVTGERKLLEKNDGYAGYEIDDDYHLRLAMKSTDDGGQELREPGAKPGEWKTWTKIPFEDSLTTATVGFDRTGHTLYLMDSRGRDKVALTAYDTRKKTTTVLAEDARVDLGDVVRHPRDRKVQAVSSTYLRRTWKVLDPAIAPDFEYLRTVSEGDFYVGSRSLDDATWLVAYDPSDGPTRYYRYDRTKKPHHATFLFTTNSKLESAKLVPMHPHVIKSRDGLDLVSYLTVPRKAKPSAEGVPEKPVPMVLLVHGGPWGRDEWGMDSHHQWLASRGYAVLSVNFRGSTGFGKQFIAAGNKEWAGKMHDDLLDAVDWAVKKGVADKDKIAIYGGSYGGYSTLVGMTFTPDTFACGVDIVGPSNLETLLATVPPYWASFFEQFALRVGDPRTPDGKKLLADRSPLHRAGAIKRPLLIGQGANDPRVKQAEADQIVKAMQDKGIPVTYVLYSDEGHGFARPENRLSFNAVAETFLAQCLGGPYQPIGDDFKGSTIAVPQGASGVVGVAEALPAAK